RSRAPGKPAGGTASPAPCRATGSVANGYAHGAGRGAEAQAAGARLRIAASATDTADIAGRTRTGPCSRFGARAGAAIDSRYDIRPRFSGRHRCARAVRRLRRVHRPGRLLLDSGACRARCSGSERLGHPFRALFPRPHRSLRDPWRSRGLARQGSHRGLYGCANLQEWLIVPAPAAPAVGANLTIKTMVMASLAVLTLGAAPAPAPVAPVPVGAAGDAPAAPFDPS